jgi:hypothetical protein
MTTMMVAVLTMFITKVNDDFTLNDFHFLENTDLFIVILVSISIPLIAVSLTRILETFRSKEMLSKMERTDLKDIDNEKNKENGKEIEK